MKKVAVILDGAFVLSNLYRALDRRFPTAYELWEYAHACVRGPEEELFRIYFYDCPPYDGSERNPLSGEVVDFSRTRTNYQRTQIHEELARMDHVAFRRGVLAFNGWRIGRRAMENLLNYQRPLAPGDLEPDLTQKRVDMKIGLDVAWLATKQIVDRIILVTGDSDFVPVMKFARHEGVQVVLVTMGSLVRQELREHADESRTVDVPPRD
jgi:uncharacterized LabA/DUF88 family protein